MDWYAHPDESLRELTARSIVALIRPGRVDESDPENVRIVAPSLGESRDFCEGERFFDDPRAANCSGTLVDVDLVLTAGHCVDDIDDCRNYRYVFDYYHAAAGELQHISAAEDVYRCEELVERRLSDGIDYAIIRLDRPVEGDHAPAVVRLGDAAMEEGAGVSIIGFGSGVPAKIDDGGVVLNARPDTRDWFDASLDAFGGNSGSGVFDASNALVGILVRGASDYVDDGGCTRVAVLPATSSESDFGEDVVYAWRAIEALCADDFESPLCGGPAGYCRSCESADDCEEGFVCGPANDGTGDSWCGASCAFDDDCRSDHFCADGGYCSPGSRERCFEGDVYFYNTCGRRQDIAENCGRSEFCSDAACVDAGEGNGCTDASEIEPVTQTVSGDLDTGYTDGYVGSCGGDGVERVFRFRLEEETRVVATAAGFDTVLYLRVTCEGTDTELDCVDDSNPPGAQGSRINTVLEPGTYYLFLDAFGQRSGSFELDLAFLPVCPCEEGATRCDGAQLETCAASGDICPSWQSAACDDGLTCVAGACVEQSDFDDCAAPREVASIDAVYSGDISAGFANDGAGSCGGAGADEVFTFTVDEEADFSARASGFDAVLHLRADCGDAASEIACDDDSGGVGSVLEATLDAGTYFLFVDSHEGAGGAYDLALTFAQACVDQCGEEGEFQCVGARSYRTCGQLDGDSCLDLSEETACEGDQRCSQLAEGCVLPPGAEDAGVDDAGSTDVDATPADAADLAEGDGGTAGSGSGRGRRRGCASVGGRGAVPWLATVLLGGLVGARRRRGCRLRG